MRRTPLRTLLALLILGSFFIPAAVAEEKGPDSAKIVGTIFGSDGKSKISGAKVHAYHLSTEATFTSAPTGNDGKYEITGLPYGYFDLAVETPNGIFVANQVANVAPTAKAVLSFTIREYGDDDDDERRAFPGAQSDSSGVANVRQRLTGRDFWKSPKGIAVIGGSAGAALLAIAAGGGSDSPASATQPARQDP